MLRIQLLLLLSILSLQVQAAELSYSYMRIGNALDKVSATTAGTVLMGGSVDVDAAFKWMCARSGDGDFLVIRTKDDDAYNPYIQELCPHANSVATLIIPSVAAANDAFVISTIKQAEAVFISGGDQSEYINFWQGTPVQDALNELIANDKPIGGTSAGLHVLTEFVYSAQEKSGVTSNQALADPFDKKMTFERDFVKLPILKGVIADSHYFKRDRIGRNLSFLCRIYDKGWSDTPRSIAVDNRTALLIDADGQAKVVGDRAAYFLQAHGAPQSCSNERPLTYEDVGVYRVEQGSASFDLSQWQGHGGYDYAISAIQGELTSTQDDDSSY